MIIFLFVFLVVLNLSKSISVFVLTEFSCYSNRIFVALKNAKIQSDFRFFTVKNVSQNCVVIFEFAKEKYCNFQGKCKTDNAHSVLKTNSHQEGCFFVTYCHLRGKYFIMSQSFSRLNVHDISSSIT